jgi:hypothetical protein
MIVVLNHGKYRLVALAVSLLIFAVVYFTVIRPDNNTANTLARQGEQQVNQAVHNAAKANPGAIPAGVTNLTSCIAAAGTDSGKLQACATKYKQ